MDWGEVFDKLGDGINRSLEATSRGITRLFGNSNERQIKRLQPNVARINSFESQMQALTDEELRGLTPTFRERLAKGETLDDLLPEAFAACREAGRRFLKMRHYDVQLLGGMVLHSGKIAEMVTGEGKTLVATLPAYLNALAGKGVHVVTVNDYLARRDAEWMNPLYTGLGMSVGAIQSSMSPWERIPVYGCDITYGTNNEFGFDYLRDNMKWSRDEQCQKHLYYAIIDEVDSILIDEARTPLIISGAATDNPEQFAMAHRIAAQLKKDVHFEVKEKEHTCHLTDAGVIEAEKLVGVDTFYSPANMHWPHFIDNALKALHLYRRDKEYIVDNGEIIIVDEHTGRKMIGRQWSDGLHQAVEAKEGVKIKEETQTLATITFQNFFKLYDKISGMTGTAMTEATEFYKIYKLDVVAIPTNRPLRRVNHPDTIFATEKEKWQAVVDEVKHVHRTGRPVLVGTTSVENSEKLSSLFDRAGIKHEVLNAKFVERESEIVAQAGRRGAVTIATNMAGRGTDILLGGNPEIQAWAMLKNTYNSRLDVPPEVWRDTVGPLEGPMKDEGRQIAEPPPTIELAKTIHKCKDPERFTQIVDEASDYERRNPDVLAERRGIVDAEEVKQLNELVDLYHLARPGGLHIVGTERHDSRRIDNQLRGRSGRQGDPGSSRFYLSLEDELMRKFMGDGVRSLLQRLGMKDGERIVSPMVSRRIDGAQKKVEERHYESRKYLLEMDEIMDVQRKRVYGFRQEVLEGRPCRELVLEMADRQIEKMVTEFTDRYYGPKAFAAFAGDRLGAKFEDREFTRCDFEQASRLAKEEALREAEGTVATLVDENLPEDGDKSEWSWSSLASQVNSLWGLKLKDYELRRLGREKIGEFIFDHVKRTVDAVSLDAGEECFTADFGLRNLVGWFNQKFNADLDRNQIPDEKKTAPAAELADWLQDEVRRLYRRKEIHFPVEAAMNQFMAEKNVAGSSKYDREGLVAWAKQRFGVELDLMEIRELPRHRIVEKLLDVSANFYKDGAIFDAIEQKLSAQFPHANSSATVDKLQPLSQWSEQTFGRAMEFSDRTISRERTRWQLYSFAELQYRPELHLVERQVVLQFIDTAWKDHLYGMDHLKSGIGLRGYAGQDAKVEYKREGRVLFDEMWDSVDQKVVEILFRVEHADPGYVSHVFHATNAYHAQTTEFQPDIRQQQEAAIEQSRNGDTKTAPIRNKAAKVGRNEPCPCGSGKKYKNCHGKAGVR
jgi:preprotein translocase subunit SecA